jgi:AraC-like DNA-binding protein
MSMPVLVDCADYQVEQFSCPGGPTHWSADAVMPGQGMILVRRGVFRLRSAGKVMLADPTSGIIQSAGSQVATAHPAGADTYTYLSSSAALWSAAVGDEPGLTAFHLDGRIELAYLMLLRAARAADVEFGVAEQLVRLLATAAHGWSPLPGTEMPPVVAAAREAILASDPCARGLLPMAAALGVSPYQLSRRFSASVGMSLTQYRNRVRVSRALSRLEAGERDLAGLAAELGFADQAHLTRAMKAAAGFPPGAVRAMALGPDPWPDPALIARLASAIGDLRDPGASHPRRETST